MRRNWQVVDSGLYVALVLQTPKAAVVVHLETDGAWYGIVPLPHRLNLHVQHKGAHLGWSHKKAKRKALKHLFRTIYKEVPCAKPSVQF